MPLPKRLIEPTFVARSVYERNELPNELETVTNTTLTNIVRQLSSLSKHSEDLFGELARDTNGLAERANSLQARIDRLSVKVTQLDSNVEEVSLQDIQLKKAFKSATIFDQQIFSRNTMPTAMLETYQNCDKPPPLDKLNVYRDDGKDGLKFYTDPNYFFELWRQEMLKDTERVMHGKRKDKPKAEGGQQGSGGGKRHNKRVRQPTNTREKQRQIAIGQGETLMPNNVIYRTPNSIINQEEPIYDKGYNMGLYDQRPNRPNSIELRRSYQTEAVDGYAPSSPQYMQQNSYTQQQYDEYQQQQMYGQQEIYSPGTPSRGGSKPRPSQPPPAPPSSGSGGGTPNASNGNTPTRGRSMSTGREVLPPPPPIPEGLMQSPPHQMHMNGMMHKNQMHLARSSSQTRADSPQMQDVNAMIMQQLNNQINNINNISMHMNQMHMNNNDLPPPPPIPDQMSPKPMSPANNMHQKLIPPPPPPPPILDHNDSVMNPPQMMKMSNGELTNGILMSKLKAPPKKVITPQEDNRSDLMNAIRNGIKLRKVEKQNNDAKEERNSKALHDVASILARRVAIELSDSESESDDDSEGWIEPNETSA